ncbi:MAG TPA: hypothetical protein VMI54_15845 [Polyangiaceae bacterium]|nr:hypothetical protein [Polyangiaceae bacterium]
MTSPGDPLVIPEKPEQLGLWRQILDRREKLAASARSWHEFLARQRADFERRDEEHAEMGVPSAARANARQVIDEAEVRFKRGIAELLRVVASIDEAVRAGSKETSKDGRGLSMKQLRELADPRDDTNLDREQAIGYVLLYLEAKKGNRGDDAGSSTAKQSAAAVLKACFGSDVDVSALEQDARQQRKDREGSGELRALAVAMVDLARASG